MVLDKKILMLFFIAFGFGSITIKATEGKEKSTPQEDLNTNIDVTEFIKDSGKKDLKIRYIDTFSAMRDSQEGIEVSKKLDKERIELTKDIELEEKKFSQALTEYKGKASTMSDSARSKEEQRLAKMERDYKNKVQESEETLKISMQHQTERLAKEVDEAVAKIAKQQNLDAVVDMHTGRLVFCKQDSDIVITAEITKQMDKNRSVRLAKSSVKKTNVTTI